MSNVDVFPDMWAAICDDCGWDCDYPLESWAEEEARKHEC